MSVVGVVAAGAGGVETLRTGLVVPLLAQGHRVSVTLTPTAGAWLRHLGEWRALEELTGLPVRDRGRLPTEPRPHPDPDVLVAAPLTAGSTAKLALGVGNNQALTVLSEALGIPTPMVVFPRVNAAHARHPAWPGHLERLRAAGVHLLYGEDVWPLLEPRTPDQRPTPWPPILAAVQRAASA